MKTRILLSFDQMPGGRASPRATDPGDPPPPKLWWNKPYREGYGGKAAFADYGAPYFVENVQIQRVAATKALRSRAAIPPRDNWLVINADISPFDRRRLLGRSESFSKEC